MSHLKTELLSRNCQAFLTTARTRHFGNAAKVLCISPSALSQRISALEDQLQSKLFDRTAHAIGLTDTGSLLLRYCQEMSAMQEEFSRDLGGNRRLGGTVTIAGFSSVTRSVLMPALSELQHQHPQLIIHFRIFHMYELREVLLRGNADFVVTQDCVQRSGYQSILLGHENNVLVESAASPRSSDVYLDHNQTDNFTEHFLLHHGQELSKPLRRRYCADIYGILASASLGLGRAVVPVHLLKPPMALEIVPGYEAPLVTPVLLQFPSKDSYPSALRAVRDALLERCASFLEQNHCAVEELSA